MNLYFLLTIRFPAYPHKNMRSFRRLTRSTLVAVYILILVGGVVRSTGSGMGCPDWPKCFGSWIPPSSVSELPANYKEVYAAYRQKKNIRFAKYLSTFGMKETGERILNDPNVLHENDFNPTKTWIEYINRVIGVIIGFLIFAVLLVSWKFRKSQTKTYHYCGHCIFTGRHTGMDRFVCGLHQLNALDHYGSHVSGAGHCCFTDLSGSSKQL